MKRGKRYFLCFMTTILCILPLLSFFGCIGACRIVDYYGFIDSNTTWVSEEGDVFFSHVDNAFLGTVIKDGDRKDFLMVQAQKSSLFYLSDIDCYYRGQTDPFNTDRSTYECWTLKSHTKTKFSVVVSATENGSKFTEDGRVITFYRDDDAPSFDFGGREWIEFGERPVDLFDTAWREATGAGDLQIGHAPLFFGSDNTGDYLMRIDGNMYFLYPVTSVALIGTDEFEATCLGYWQKKKDQPINGGEGLECLGILYEDFRRTVPVYDENELINLKIGYYFSDWKNYPGMVMETSTGYRLTVGDPATMTGTMTIDGEVVDVTWVMEDYYHSDIVRVYRTADYESEDFSAEDDLLCRMKVRCTDDAHTVFVATVVGDGVFPDGTSWTYRKEI